MEEETDSENKIICVLAGDSFVGKTNLILRFADDKYEDNQNQTIGIDIKMKKVTLDNKEYQLNLYDTAGQEKFKSMVGSYFKNADCAYFVYQITNRESFQNINNWIETCKSAQGEVLMVLIGNKCDLEKERKVSKEEGENLAQKYGIPFYETSAKTGANVQEAFTESLKNLSVKDIPKEVEDDYNSRKKSYRLIKEDKEEKKQKKDKGCCCG
jgi:small GTP-binding protein